MATAPSKPGIDAIRQAGIFTYLVTEDTYAAASEVHDLLVKTHPADTEKIEPIQQLVAEHLDVDRVLARLPRSRSATLSAPDVRRSASSLSMSRVVAEADSSGEQRRSLDALELARASARRRSET